MLIVANQKYVERVENSKHFLNCPTHMLNNTLDCFYRQFHNNLNRAESTIYEYLKSYGYSNPKKKARDFVVWRDSITLKEFNRKGFVDPY